jgi:hypothetical protein
MEISRFTEQFQPDCIVFRVKGHTEMHRSDVPVMPHRLEFDRQTWEKMGRPTEIVMTISPEDNHVD